MRVQLQHAYILHRRVYRDTSLIVELLSRDFGRISAVARGARRSRNNALLQPFQPVLCSWFGRGELYTLGNIEPADVYQKINGQHVLSGLYLNELLMRLLPKEEPIGKLYDYYAEAVSGLAQLAVNDVECRNSDFCEQQILRRFEKGLLEQLGYGVDFSLDSETNKQVCTTDQYIFVSGKGLIQTSVNSVISGASLLALANDQLDSEQSLREAKRLLRTILDQYLGSRPLQSRELRYRYARQKKSLSINIKR
ncbi:DNA recombination and repair protein RecO [hydrothermal vent metagenome]|uniref:DNA repair protein RecO n=1 Tax=hydrothermal vent metagenome TaxID=652676 RepID=A0A3B1A2S1_9ZZZZ